MLLLSHISIAFKSIWYISVHFSLFGSFGPLWSISVYLVQCGPLWSIWYISVHLVTFDPYQSTSVNFNSFNQSTVELWLRLVCVKVFPENRYFLEMLFSEKENIFMCLFAFQKMFWKIFSDVWLCSWKYHRKHIFYLLLTFSHIFLVTKRIHNIIHSSKHKQNPKKKSSNSDKRRPDRDLDRRDRDWRDLDRR